MTQPTEGRILANRADDAEPTVAGACECGWVGPQRQRHSEALIDINEHNTIHTTGARREEVAP